jgi:hypothetical protein
VSESTVQARIRLALGKLPYLRLFRNNCGKLPDPRTGRWLEFGVGNPGGGDLLGWKTVTVTPEMVGQQVAVFTSIEVKTPTGRLRPEQEQWMKVVRAAGGIAGVARSVEDAEALVRQGSE